MRKWWEAFLLIASVCLVAMPTPIAAQQQVGGLRVIVTDQTGSVIPGAEVELNSAALIRPAFGISDDQGLVINTNLPSGNYTVAVRFPGFQTAVNEEVVVEAGTASIDTFKSESATVYTGDRLTDAAGGRDFTDYARFTPSVNIEAQAGNVDHKGRKVRGISVDGASGAENVFYVDGVDTTNMYNGLNNQNLRVETVREFQLKTAGYEAEFGGAMGGVLSVQTKSGANEFHGSALWYGSGSLLTGAPSKRLRLDPSQAVDVSEYVFNADDLAP